MTAAPHHVEIEQRSGIYDEREGFGDCRWSWNEGERRPNTNSEFPDWDWRALADGPLAFEPTVEFNVY